MSYWLEIVIALILVAYAVDFSGYKLISIANAITQNVNSGFVRDVWWATLGTALPASVGFLAQTCNECIMKNEAPNNNCQSSIKYLMVAVFISVLAYRQLFYPEELKNNKLGVSYNEKDDADIIDELSRSYGTNIERDTSPGLENEA